METKNLRINFAAMAPVISVQLAEQGIIIEKTEKERYEKVLYFDRLKTAINELWFSDLITENQADSARNKLFKKIKTFLESLTDEGE